MREDLLNELEAEYETQRIQNEREEAARRDKIRLEYPDIEKKVMERRDLVFGTIRRMLDGNAKKEDLPGKMAELNQSIATMLRENGLPEDYLEPVYRCRKCRDTGYTGELIREPCSCMMNAYRKKIRERIGLGKGEEETFETFNAEIIPENLAGRTGITQRRLTEIARDCCKKWAAGYPDVSERDMLLTGPSGVGKTFLMHAMASLLIERGVNVLMVSAFTFLQLARKSYFDAEDGVEGRREVPVLMLDDLGCEPLM